MTYADGRYGALDIGTVTCRLLVADVEDGRIIDVDKEYAITDLGVGVDATGRLSEAAIVNEMKTCRFFPSFIPCACYNERRFTNLTRSERLFKRNCTG